MKQWGPQIPRSGAGETLVPHSVMCSQINAAVAAEREACAKIAEEHWEPDPHQFPKQIAAAIRARFDNPER